MALGGNMAGKAPLRVENSAGIGRTRLAVKLFNRSGRIHVRPRHPPPVAINQNSAHHHGEVRAESSARIVVRLTAQHLDQFDEYLLHHVLDIGVRQIGVAQLDEKPKCRGVEFNKLLPDDLIGSVRIKIFESTYFGITFGDAIGGRISLPFRSNQRRIESSAQ